MTSSPSWAEERPFSLSVVVPTHGGRTSVAVTVRALLASPHNCVEVIVVSDGDPAPAQEALSGISDVRLKILAQPKSGSAAARNLGLAHAHFDWVAFVDDDDVPRPNWFAVWAAHATRDHVALTACVKHWQGDVVLKEKRCCALDVSDPTMAASRLLAGAFIARKDALDAIGGYDVQLRASQNQDLGLRLLAHIQARHSVNSVKNTDETVMDVHTEPAVSRRQRYGTSRADAARVFQERFAERLVADPTHAASLHRIIARSALDEGDVGQFRRSAYAAVREHPRSVSNWKFGLAALIPGLGRIVGFRQRNAK